MIAMKKITLTALIIFVFIIGGVFMGAIFNKQNKNVNNNSYNVTNNQLENKKATKINSPNIDINKLQFDLVESQPDSVTMAEITKHNSRNDCYLVINNKVYDVSAYISGGYHPGGSRIIISYCGREVTGIFARIHSNRAWDLLKKYKIGAITTNKQDIKPQILTAISDALKKANPNAEIIKVRPKTNYYVAKIVFNGKLYEVHINYDGKIFQEEVEDDEADWSLWEKDNDDN